MTRTAKQLADLERKIGVTDCRQQHKTDGEMPKKETGKMTTAIEVYEPLPVCEGCGKPYTGLNDYDFTQFFDGVVDDPICDACVERGLA